MRNRAHVGIASTVLVAALLACAPGSLPDGQTTDQSADQIEGSSSDQPAADNKGDKPGLLGTVQRVADIVEHGASAETIEQVVDEVALFAGDVLRVREGGEGLLVFPDGLLLRLFNDTELNITLVESAPGTPLEIQMFLEEGGFTGELTTEGGSAVFETPGGAEITVLGADFFVAYDPLAKKTIAGNFRGEVKVAGAGQSVTLADGEFVEVPDGGPPEQPLPLTVDQDAFETAARTESSPIAATKSLSRWRLTVLHHVETLNEVIGDNNVHDWTWVGDFTVGGGALTGSGQTVVGGNTVCTDPPPAHFSISGSFDFEISGSIVSGSGGPQFALDIVGSPVTYTEGPDCVVHVNAVIPLYDTLSTDLASLTEPIVVPASDGATASIAFTAEAPPYWYDGPLEVTVEALP